VSLAHHEAVAVRIERRARVEAQHAEIQGREDIGCAEVAAGMAELGLIHHLKAAPPDPQGFLADHFEHVVARVERGRRGHG